MRRHGMGWRLAVLGSLTGVVGLAVPTTASASHSDPLLCGLGFTQFCNNPPSADFTFTPASPTTGEEVTFNSTSTDSDGTISAHAWDLDDDGAFDDATGPIASRSFPIAGTHDVSLRVTDDDGVTDTTTRSVSVAEPVNIPPLADFIFSPSAPVEDQLVTFTSTSSDSDGTIADSDQDWDLDDDGQFDDAEGLVATHTFTDPGTHEVSLRVTDNDGDSDVEEKDVVVGAGPPPPGGGDTTSPLTSRCRGLLATKIGTLGSDKIPNDIEGTAGNDVIVAFGGADDIFTGRGNDLVCAGPGADRVQGGPGKDRIFGGPGKDKLEGRHGADLLIGGAGLDFLFGGSGKDLCRGGPGRDRLDNCRSDR